MATFASLETVGAFLAILAFTSLFCTPPSQAVSRSVQTEPIDQTPEQVLEELKKTAKEVKGSLKAAEKVKSASPPTRPKSLKSVDSNSVRNGRITKRSTKKSQRITRCKGLKNSSQACYQNSVIQCLFNMREFVGYLDGIHNVESCPTHTAGTCVVCALKELLNTYADKQLSRILDAARDKLEKAMIKSIADDHPMAEDIKMKTQSDPFDFLKYVFEELAPHKSADNNLTLADLIEMEAKTEWKCDKCGNLTTRKDPEGNIGLMLNIQKPQRGLRMTAYLGPSEYSVKCNIWCESEACIGDKLSDKDGPERTVRKYITKAPEILVIRLTRFGMSEKPNPITNRMDEFKISDAVPFEEYLNLGDFTESGTPVFYQLQGVVGHKGQNLHSGHYIAGVR